MHKLIEKKVDKTNVSLKVKISKEKVSEVKEKHIAQAVSGVQIPGFRKGKAPREKALEKIDMQHVLGHAINELIQESYYKSILDEKLSPLGQPKIDLKEFEENGPLIYEASFDILPEVKLGNWEEQVKNSKIKKKEVKVLKEDVEKAINDLQKNLAEYNEVSRQAKEGDMVEIDFEGRFKEEEKNTLENLAKLKSQNHPLVLGSKTMIPGFEENLIGMSNNEEKEFEVTFPSEYHAKDFANQKVLFKVKINLIREQKLPEKNDELAKKIGIQTYAELEKKITENITKQKETESEREFEEKILELLAKQVKEEMPETLVNQELDYMLSDFSQHIMSQGLTLEQYLENSKKTIEDIRGDWKKGAETRIKISFIFELISNEKKLEVTEKEIEAQTEEFVKGGGISKENSQTEDYKKYVRNVVRNKKVIKIIKELAN